MYCVKCKQKTETVNVIHVVTKNNRRLLKGTCTACGSKKSSFVVGNKGGAGLGNAIIKAIGNLGELHVPANKGEYVPGGSFNNQNNYSNCGLVLNMNKETVKDTKEFMN